MCSKTGERGSLKTQMPKAKVFQRRSPRKKLWLGACHLNFMTPFDRVFTPRTAFSVDQRQKKAQGSADCCRGVAVAEGLGGCVPLANSPCPLYVPFCFCGAWASCWKGKKTCGPKDKLCSYTRTRREALSGANANWIMCNPFCGTWCSFANHPWPSLLRGMGRTTHQT